MTVRPRRARRAVLIALAVLLGLLLLLWTQRKPIASDFIDRELSRRGVQAHYEITQLGFRRQRLERIAIGDPKHPDLTADWAELDMAVGLTGAEVRGITARGVRVRGRLVDGVLKLGSLDRLLPPSSGKPFSLPDLRIDLGDAQMRLETAAGPVRLRIDGAGGLADGFKGRLLAAANPRSGDCGATGLRAELAVSIVARKPRLTGPIRAATVSCAGAEIVAPLLRIDATLGEALDRWSGKAALEAGRASMSAWRASRLSGSADFAGTVRQTKGALRFTAFAPAGDRGHAERASLNGRYMIGNDAPDRFADDPIGRPELRASYDGSVSVDGAAVPNRTGESIRDAGKALAGTPFEPLAESIGVALLRNGRRVDARATVAVSATASAGSLRAEALSVDGAEGARLRLTGGEGVRFAWPGSGRWQVDGRLALAGGGFPDAVIDLVQPGIGADIGGTARIAPFAARDARVALAPIRFTSSRGAIRFETSAVLDGPIPSGRVTGLSLPLSGRIGETIIINPACAPVAFQTLRLSSLTLQPARFTLCPVGGALVASRGGRLAGGARIAAPRLAGTLGSSPITLAAAGVQFGVARGDFAVAGLAARLGPENRVSRLDVARLDGRGGKGGLTGSFGGAAGKIANVPILVAGAGGSWRLAGGRLNVGGDLRVADEANPPRFNPLRAHGFTLAIDGDALTAAAPLAEPKSGISVMNVAIVHSLSRGTGHATLDAPGIAFGKAFQPEALTPLTLGVVANVEGSVRGRGEIRWSPEAVTSTGDFSTTDTALAAAFGPVTGLTGTIHFSDLLGLETPPGQTLAIGTVNPGIEVEQGVLRYQLLPARRIAVEKGRWPLAGGTLTLRPTILSFGETLDRHLTFDVTALDAAKFINKLEFENLSATGTFDGTLPMVFDADGGRIVDGSLVARSPGGTLAYVGDVSNADLGIWGGIAFDALKSIAYRNLTIDFNGAIDGEMISQIRFDGVSRGTVRPVATGLLATIGGQLASKLQALPFRFNIRIKAPFRGLAATARSFADPSILVRDSLPPGVTPEPVQPPDSEDKR